MENKARMAKVNRNNRPFKKLNDLIPQERACARYDVEKLNRD